MIADHQPKIFPRAILAAVSSRENGCIRAPILSPESAQNVEKWCTLLGIVASKTVGLYVTYGAGRSYTHIISVSEGGDQGALDQTGWVEADAIVTDTPGVALILPIADCNAVIIYDPEQRVIGLAHLGWHSTVNNLARELVEYLTTKYHSKPGSLLVYFSPSIRKESYRFDRLEDTLDTSWHREPYAILQPNGEYHIDLVKYNIDALIASGVQESHIEVCPVDTCADQRYNSHFARHQEGTTSRTTERFAALAMIRSI